MSKLLNKLSKHDRSILRRRKNILIDKINKCKTLDEICGLEKTLEYYPVLSKSYDYDYGYLIELLRFKLKRMSEYFHTHNIVENEERYGIICDKAINIIDAGYKTEIFEEDDLHVYVNTRNIHRFLNPHHLDFLLKNHDALKKYYLASVREAKAKALLWKFLGHYIEYLWD